MGRAVCVGCALLLMLGAGSTDGGCRLAAWMPATTGVAHQQRRPCAAGERSSCCVAARLRGLQHELGINGILAELNFGARIPAPEMMRSLRLLCQEVRPRLL